MILMKFYRLLLNVFNQQGKSTSPRHLFVITYGRSGSTLLMGILNSMKGVKIYGENRNILFNIFKVIQSFEKANNHYSRSITHPYYREAKLNVHKAKNTLLELAKANVFSNNKSLEWIGFKEIRHSTPSILPELQDYIRFLQNEFNNPKFIVLTRNPYDVVISRIKNFKKVNESIESHLNRIDRFEKKMENVASKTNNDDFFFIDYKSLVPESKELQDLCLFLDTTFEKEKLERVLSERHSYFNHDMLTDDKRRKIHELELLKTENSKD